jgi:thiosulfate reductase/polysulfide reductase chain A
MDVTRRNFIRIAGVGGTAAAVGSGLTTNWWGLDPNRIANPQTDGDKVVPTVCELCFWRCGVLAHVKDGRVTKIEGNPKHPLSNGMLCPRGTGATGTLYDPDRLKKPLIRTGERGKQTFREATWKEALDLIGNKLNEIKAKHGPEAIALFTHGAGGVWFKRLMKAMGSPNMGAPAYAQCRGPRTAGFVLTYGSGLGSPEPLDIKNSRCAVLIGSHLGENMHNTQVQDFADAIGNGAQFVVVDPRFSVAASKAKYWLPIKPGSDIALLLAWMHVILKEERYDKEYVTKYGHGLEELKKHVADKTPEWAYTHTSIKPELIRETARFIAGFRPASLIHPGRHVTWYGDDSQRSRAIAMLNGLLGAWGRRGGILLPPKMKVASYPYLHKLPKAAKAPADKPKGTGYVLDGSRGVLTQGMRDATIPGTADYDIKAWIVYGTNLPLSLPQPKKTLEAIQKLDFMVAIDIQPAEICGWADVVLPECTYLERYDDLFVPYYERPFVALRQPAIEPMFASKPGWWMAKEIASRMSLETAFPWKDAKTYLQTRMARSKMDWMTLRKDGVLLGKKEPVCEEDGLALTFDTPSKKIEFYCDDLKKAGQPPMPEYTPHEEPPEGMFRLLFGRAPVHSFGRTTNNRLLSEVFSENEVWINTEICDELGLSDKEKVMLVNQDGEKAGPVRIRATQRIRQDCVFMVHGYGRRAKGLKFAHGKGASDSDLVTRSVTDPIMGGTGMNVNFVRVQRVGRA